VSVLCIKTGQDGFLFIQFLIYHFGVCHSVPTIQLRLFVFNFYQVIDPQFTAKEYKDISSSSKVCTLYSGFPSPKTKPRRLSLSVVSSSLSPWFVMLRLKTYIYNKHLDLALENIHSLIALALKCLQFFEDKTPVPFCNFKHLTPSIQTLPYLPPGKYYFSNLEVISNLGCFPKGRKTFKAVCW
jgi:hypothetical protein